MSKSHKLLVQVDKLYFQRDKPLFIAENDIRPRDEPVKSKQLVHNVKV